MRAKRITKKYPSSWKLTRSDLLGIHPSHQRIADAMVAYMNGTNRHDIRNLERVVMNTYEEERVMARFDCKAVRFKWVTIAKQHVSPFKERYAFAVYSGNKLLSAVFESENLAGSVVQRKDYEAI